LNPTAMTGPDRIGFSKEYRYLMIHLFLRKKNSVISTLFFNFFFENQEQKISCTAVRLDRLQQLKKIKKIIIFDSSGRLGICPSASAPCQSSIHCLHTKKEIEEQK